MNKTEIETILEQEGYKDFKWISGSDVVTARWVRMKCMFGCPNYGTKGSCPPNTPPIEECREFFREYENIVVIRIRKKLAPSENAREWTSQTNRELLELERASFRAGYMKAFIMFIGPCGLCEKCVKSREECTDKISARPSAEAMGADVFSTVRDAGFEIQTLTELSDEMDRYGFLLVE